MQTARSGDVQRRTLTRRDSATPGIDRIFRMLPRREMLVERLAKTGRTISVGQYMMVTIGVIAVVTVVATLGAQSGFSRVVLQDHPLSAPGRHAVSARADFAPGAAAGRHTHPGEEIGYILEGTVQLSVEGRATATLRQGDVFYIPSGVPHDGHNPGSVKAAILSTFFAEQDKPLASPAK